MYRTSLSFSFHSNIFLTIFRTDLTTFYHLINANNLVFLHQLLWKYRVNIFAELNTRQTYKPAEKASIVRRADVLIGIYISLSLPL